MVKFLIDQNAEINAVHLKNQYTPIFNAALYGNTNIFKYLLTKNANLNTNLIIDDYQTILVSYN